MTTQQAAILDLLKQRRGPQQAITAGEIAAAIFGDRRRDREVRVIIKALIEDGGCGEIVANTGAADAFPGCPRGYFWATSAQQIEQYRHVLASRLEEIGHRLAAAGRAAERLRQPGAQLAMEMD